MSQLVSTFNGRESSVGPGKDSRDRRKKENATRMHSAGDRADVLGELGENLKKLEKHGDSKDTLIELSDSESRPIVEMSELVSTSNEGNFQTHANVAEQNVP